MHPQVIREAPGLCPICHMHLTPLKAQEKSDAGGNLVPVHEDETDQSKSRTSAQAVTIDPAVVQNMGIRVVTVSAGPLRKSLSAVGYLEEAQPNIHDINLRVSGWVRRLYASTEGQHLQEGEPLFDLYSPELQVAIGELLSASRARKTGLGEGDVSSSLSTLYKTAAQKLELLGLERKQIEALSRADRVPEVVTFVSPLAGHVTEKPVVDGAAVKAGDRVLRIVDHTTLWLDAQVFEKDLPLVHLGDAVTATVSSYLDEEISGSVIFIHPHLDMMTRTATVRIEIRNPSLKLRPGMFAAVRLLSEIAKEAAIVPREAIIDSGEKQMAFVVLEHGKFEPRRVEMGLTGEGGMVQILHGLTAGERVVVSGQFLLDSESRLQEAVQKYLDEKRDMP